MLINGKSFFDCIVKFPPLLFPPLSGLSDYLAHQFLFLMGGKVVLFNVCIPELHPIHRGQAWFHVHLYQIVYPPRQREGSVSFRSLIVQPVKHRLTIGEAAKNVAEAHIAMMQPF